MPIKIPPIKNITLYLGEYVRFQLKGHSNAWHIFTHLTSQERMMLYHFARHLKAGNIICEIGSYLGASACFLAAGSSEVIGEPVAVHCVDTWDNKGMTEGPKNTWNEFKKNVAGYESLIITHRGKSVDVARDFKKQIDLLFLDGDHSYEGCRSDIESWFPHLKPGGLVIMHDYGWAEGVQQVVQEIISPLTIKEDRLPNLYWGWIK